MNEKTPEENLPRVLSALEMLTEEELVQLNHVIVQRLRLMQQIRAHGKMINLRVGQRVKFKSPNAEVVRGTISRMNRKSVTVVTEGNGQWLVAPELLEVE